MSTSLFDNNHATNTTINKPSQTFMQDTHTPETVAILSYPSQHNHQPHFPSDSPLPLNNGTKHSNEPPNEQYSEQLPKRETTTVEKTDSSEESSQQPNNDTIFPQQEIKLPIPIPLPPSKPTTSKSPSTKHSPPTLPDKCDSDSPQESKIQDNDKQQKGVLLFEKEEQQDNQQNKQVNKWFYIGDDEDDDEISEDDEEEEEDQDIVESSSSSSDDEDGEEEQVFDEEQEQDEDLLLQDEFDDTDSDQEEPSDDELQQDYDNQEIQNILRQLPNSQQNRMNKLHYIMQYKANRLNLESEQQKIKDFQLNYGLVPLPIELQLQKSLISESILNLVNQHYLLNLELEGGKRLQQKALYSESEQIDSEKQTESKQKIVEDNQKKPKPVRKVMFKESIQLKSFKDAEEVIVMNNKQEKCQILNNQEKKPVMKKIFALPRQFPLSRLPSSSDIIQKISKSIALQRQKKLEEEQKKKRQAQELLREKQRQIQLQLAKLKNQAEQSSQPPQNNDQQAESNVQFPIVQPQRKYSIDNELENDQQFKRMNDQFLQKFQSYNQEMKKRQMEMSEQIKQHQVDIDQRMKSHEIIMKGHLQEFINMNQIFSNYLEQEELILLNKNQQRMENEQQNVNSPIQQTFHNQDHLDQDQFTKPFECSQQEQIQTIIKGVEEVTSDMNDLQQQIVSMSIQPQN